MATEIENHTLALLRDIRRDIAELRRDNARDHADFRRALIAFSDQSRRVLPDLEQMVRMELMGRLADFETRSEQRLDDGLREFADRFGLKPEPPTI